MDLEGHAPDSKSSSKWRAFRDDVQSVLKAFDGAKEWPDVIKCLNKLAKALDNKKYEKFVTIPEKLTLCKRLAQCLNPSLPAGVHQKALEVCSTAGLEFHGHLMWVAAVNVHSRLLEHCLRCRWFFGLSLKELGVLGIHVPPAPLQEQRLFFRTTVDSRKIWNFTAGVPRVWSNKLQKSASWVHPL